MNEMICPRCKTKLSVRKSKRATYIAPEIIYCTKCEYTTVTQDNAAKPASGNKK